MLTMQPQTDLHDPCQDSLNPCEKMFLVKDQGGGNIVRFITCRFKS